MITLDHIRAAIDLPDFDPLPAQVQMAPLRRALRPEPGGEPPRQAGVLVLLYPQDAGWQIVLTRRTDQLRGHSGQISFPGGTRDPRDPSFAATALRETCEELGLCDDGLLLLGELSPIYIPPSHFEVHPAVAAAAAPPDFNPNPEEVAEVFSLPIERLLSARIKRQEFRDFQGYRVRVPYYLVQGHKVWGATAVMLSELEHRLRAVLPRRELDLLDAR